MPDNPDGAPSPHEPGAYPALFSDFLPKLTEAPAEEDVAFFRSLIDEATARNDGARFESASVLDAAREAIEIALPSVVAGKVPGYGALRLRYVTDLCLGLANHVAQLDTAIIEASGASVVKTTTLRSSRKLRRRALRALKCLGGRNREQRARTRKAAKGEEKPDERARSLDAIATELESVRAKAPARVADDAGATPALIGELRAYAQAVLSARTDAQGSRGSLATLYDIMNVLDGRILLDLRALTAALRDARREDKSVPALRIKLLDRKARRSGSPVVTEAQAPTKPEDAKRPDDAKKVAGDK